MVGQHGTHPQIPNIANFRILVIGNNGVFAFAAILQLETALVCKVQKADETEARADLVHLILRIRLLQARDDVIEHSSLGWVRSWTDVRIL